MFIIYNKIYYQKVNTQHAFIFFYRPLLLTLCCASHLMIAFHQDPEEHLHSKDAILPLDICYV